MKNHLMNDSFNQYATKVLKINPTLLGAENGMLPQVCFPREGLACKIG